MKVAIRWLSAFALLAGVPSPQAAFHLFRIEQIYTNADGSVQFVVLGECCGANGEHFWAGITLRLDGAAAHADFQFPTNLPSSSDTANAERPGGHRRASPPSASSRPNYIMPANFLPIGGGSLNYAGVQPITFGPMPTDGTNALLANGTVVPNVATNFAGQSGSVTGGARDRGGNRVSTTRRSITIS